MLKPGFLQLTYSMSVLRRAPFDLAVRWGFCHRNKP